MMPARSHHETGATAWPRHLRVVSADDAISSIVSQSSVMQALVNRARKYAASTATILLTGETGTGKELMARLVHECSARATQRYARVNCAALSEHLIASELFGHERGAFTGAEATRKGRFEWAAGGTLLLDEIGELPLALQAKLLRVLEEQEFQRVGANETLVADVRVIASTNRDLSQQVNDGRFRSDLFYRLNVLPIHVPPLRERQADIIPLAQQFMHEFRRESETPVREIGAAAIEQLESHAWPGNIRELRNTIHHACVVAQHGVIQPQDLPFANSVAPNLNAYTGMTLEEVERATILQTLSAANGNKTLAASQLGVTPRTLRNKLSSYRQQGHC